MAFRKAVAALAFLLVLGITGPGVALAASGPGVSDLEALASKLAEPATQKEAILKLQELGNPSVETLLRALKEGALYRWKEGVAILGEDGSLKDTRGRPILDLQGKPVSPKEGQEAIALEEGYFGLVQRILERLEVFGADREVRKSAAFRLGNSRDLSTIPLLSRAVEREADPEVRAAIEEAMVKLQLSAPDPSTRARRRIPGPALV